MINPKTQKQYSSKPKKEKVPIKMNPAQKAEIDFVKQKGPLQDSFVCTLVTPKGARQVTIHHPIGVTDLRDSDWVLTDTNRIQDLLDRQKDPGWPRLVELRKQTRLAAAVGAGLLKKDAATGHYCYPKGADRDVLMVQARERAEESIKGDIEKWTKTCQNLKAGEQRPSKPQVPDILSFLPPDNQKEEIDFRAFMQKPETIRIAEVQHPQTFRTCSGPLSDQKQERINELNLVLTPHEVQDKLFAYIFGFKPTGGIPVVKLEENREKAGKPPAPPGQGEDHKT